MTVSKNLIKRSQALTYADQHGWDLEVTGNNHIRARCPEGCCVVILANSESDWRSGRNAISLMRRCAGRKVS